eukprot:gene24414-biopygen16421
MHHTQPSPRQVVWGRMEFRQFKRHRWNDGQPCDFNECLGTLRSPCSARDWRKRGCRESYEQGRAPIHLVYGAGGLRPARVRPATVSLDAIVRPASGPRPARVRCHFAQSPRDYRELGSARTGWPDCDHGGPGMAQHIVWSDRSPVCSKEVLGQRSVGPKKCWATSGPPRTPNALTGEAALPVIPGALGREHITCTGGG